MAVIPNATTTTSLQQVVASGDFARIIDATRAVFVFSAIAWARVAGPGAIYKFPTFNPEASSPTDTDETDEYPVIEVTAARQEAVRGNYGHRTYLSKEAAMDMEITIQDLLRHGNSVMWKVIDIDVLSQFQNAANTSPYLGQPLTKSRFIQALAAYQAQEPIPGFHAFVGAHKQLETLREDISTGSQAIEATGQALPLFKANSGYLGTYMGIEMYQSGNVQEFDGANWGGGFTKLSTSRDDPGGIGLAVWQRLEVEPTPRAERGAMDYVFSALWGTTIAKQNMIRQVVTAKV